MPDLLAVSELSVEFATDRGVARVLDRISLAIAPGEVVGLVGESGCGKTTLGRTILGILPDSGRIRGGAIHFKGRDLLQMDPGLVNDEIRGRAITFIPQDPWSSLSPLFPVETQIMDLMKWKSPLGYADRGGVPARRGWPAIFRGYADRSGRRARNGWPAIFRGYADRSGRRARNGWPAIFRGYARDRRRADRASVLDVLRAVQIPEPERALRRLPHEFSGGQRQRLMIAMALLPSPDLIVADEPTTALDVTIQAQILRLLRDLVKERGVSVLFSTHDLGTAWEICDRVVVMYAGQEMESAPTDAFFARPAHPYTVKLLDSLPSPSGLIQDIPGEVPSLIGPPAGCRFHPRCDYATAECGARRPDARALGGDHRVRCFHPVGAA